MVTVSLATTTGGEVPSCLKQNMLPLFHKYELEKNLEKAPQQQYLGNPPDLESEQARVHTSAGPVHSGEIIFNAGNRIRRMWLGFLNGL